MLINRILMWIITLTFILFISSCWPGKYRKFTLSLQAEQEKVDAYSVKNVGQYYHTSELLKNIGTPEKQIQVKDLFDFIKSIDRTDSKYIDEDINKIYYQYLEKLSNQRINVDINKLNWRDSENFLKSEIWFYNLSDPNEIVLGGIFPQKTGIHLIYYFLVDGDGVIFGDELLISKKCP